MEATRRMGKSKSLASTKSGALSFSITSILSTGEYDGEEEEIDVEECNEAHAAMLSLQVHYGDLSLPWLEVECKVGAVSGDVLKRVRRLVLRPVPELRAMVPEWVMKAYDEKTTKSAPQSPPARSSKAQGWSRDSWWQSSSWSSSSDWRHRGSGSRW